MNPADDPEVVGTLVIVFVFAVHQRAVAFGQDVLLPQIVERAAAGEHHDKEIGGEIRVGAGMGAPCVNLADLLQVEKILSCKLRRGVQYAVGADEFAVVAGMFHVGFSFQTNYTQKVNIMQIYGNNFCNNPDYKAV